MKRLITGMAGIAILGGGTAIADQAQNPYESRADHYELSVHADIAQGDRVEIAKTSPQVTLSRWNDEQRVTITPQFPGAGRVSNASRPLLSKRMQFTKGNLTAYVQPAAATSDFDIDFELASKPASNVFTYAVAGADDLDFFYQAELSPAEKAEGLERPDNVIGSYAVYSKAHKDHVVGQTNYATGKLFHIYRPKAIDAKGNEAWAELSYETGTLSVTVPQDFLESAAYPVTVDPTFGYTSLGASTSFQSANVLWGYKATAPENGTVTSISLAGRKFSGDIHFKCVLVELAGKTIVTNGICPSNTVNSTTAQFWTTSFVSQPSISSGLDYPISWIADATFLVSSDSGSTGFAFGDGSNSYASPSNPTDGGITDGSPSLYSIYATYTPIAAPSSPDDGLILFD